MLTRGMSTKISSECPDQEEDRSPCLITPSSSLVNTNDSGELGPFVLVSFPLNQLFYHPKATEC